MRNLIISNQYNPTVFGEIQRRLSDAVQTAFIQVGSNNRHPVWEFSYTKLKNELRKDKLPVIGASPRYTRIPAEFWESGILCSPKEMALPEVRSKFKEMPKRLILLWSGNPHEAHLLSLFVSQYFQAETECWIALLCKNELAGLERLTAEKQDWEILQSKFESALDLSKKIESLRYNWNLNASALFPALPTGEPASIQHVYLLQYLADFDLSEAGDIRKSILEFSYIHERIWEQDLAELTRNGLVEIKDIARNPQFALSRTGREWMNRIPQSNGMVMTILIAMSHCDWDYAKASMHAFFSRLADGSGKTSKRFQ